MERAQWTDERLDREMDKIDRVFDESRADRQAMRNEFAALRDELRSDMAGLRSEMVGMRLELRSDINDLRVDLTGFQRQMLYILGGFVTALIGLLGVWVA